MNKTIALAEEIGRTLTGPGVIGAWLFGSAKDGAMRESADIDIGVLFEPKPGLDQLATLREQLQRALNFKEIDLVVLNEALPILRFEALSGHRVVCRDEERCAEIASLTAREYEDEMAGCGTRRAKLRSAADEESSKRVAQVRAKCGR